MLSFYFITIAFNISLSVTNAQEYKPLASLPPHFYTNISLRALLPLRSWREKLRKGKFWKLED
jgi:hypothetical protein